MKQLSNRVWLAAVVMVLSWIGTTWVRSGYSFDVKPLSQGLQSFPLEIGDFTGTDLPLDEEVSKILNADSTLNRSYRNPEGTSLALHVSAWIRPDTIATVAPHSPKVCYTNAGWKILKERLVECNTSSGVLPMSVLLLDRDGERCVVGYWYQMGRANFNTAQEARAVHRALWGKKTWPPTIKFLIQTPGQDIESVLPRMEKFASTVFQWSLEL